MVTPAAPRNELDLSLVRVHQVLCALNHPECRIPKIIHVAGTNGKGSTCSFLVTGLAQVYSTVAFFCSPALVEPRDAWRVCRHNHWDHPTSETFQRHVQHVLSTAHSLQLNPNVTHFETHFMGFLFWVLHDLPDIDAVVIEVGLGGLNDATNVFYNWPCPHPLSHASAHDQHRPTSNNVVASVITPIGLDHTALLGHTHEEIALHKAGILHDAPCFVGLQSNPAVLEKIHAKCLELGIPCFSLHRNPSPPPPPPPSSASVLPPSTVSSFASEKGIAPVTETPETIQKGASRAFTVRCMRPPLLENTSCGSLPISSVHWTSFQLDEKKGSFEKGGYQIQNAALAYMVLQHLFPDHHSPVDIDRMRSEMSWPGRLTYVVLPARSPVHPPITAVVDGAHNVDGATALCESLAQGFLPVGRHRVYVVGFLSHKAPHDFLPYLRRLLSVSSPMRISLVLCEFTPPHDMAWQKAHPSSSLKTMVVQAEDVVSRLEGVYELHRIWDLPSRWMATTAFDAREDAHVVLHDHEKKGDEAMEHAVQWVITGSLYLVSDVYGWIQGVRGPSMPIEQ